MKRREFIILLGGAAATWPVVARAQRSEKIRRIGVLMNLAADDSEAQIRVAALMQVSTPEQRSIGGPEQKYINGAGKKVPELGAFSSCIRLGWMIRRRIGIGTA